MFSFRIRQKHKYSQARLGILRTPHGVIHTPAFVPVATKGAFRGVDFETVKNYGGEIFMMNTFHLFCDNRYKIIERAGGLHKFINWSGPIMTDSGGFQVFSLGFGNEYSTGKVAIFSEEDKLFLKGGGQNLVKVDDYGVDFRSPYDNRRLRLTPELSIKIQQKLGADIIFAFDECTSPLSDYQYTKKAVQRTHRWAEKCLKVFKNKKQVMFGVVQGGEYKDLRKKSAKFIGQLPFFGFGIGGAFGKKTMYRTLAWITPFLPENKPRHLLGIGEPKDIIESVKKGMDLFDCVIPTRWARHATALTSRGRLDLKAAKHLKDQRPLDEKCLCRVCRFYSRAYLCHLVKEKEIFGIMLLAEHNLFWLLNFMKQIRQMIRENKKF